MSSQTETLPRCANVRALLTYLRDRGIEITCRQTIYNLSKRGIIPRPFHVGRWAFWSLDDIDQTILRLKGEAVKDEA
jgi:hypothetical protein